MSFASWFAIAPQQTDPKTPFRLKRGLALPGMAFDT